MLTWLSNRIGCGALLIVGVAAQQQTAPAGPTFDVVSIRLVPPNPPMIMRDAGYTPILPGGQFAEARATAQSLIAMAYETKTISAIEGLPAWAKAQLYSIAAKPAPGFPGLSEAENARQVRLMLRAMLADRFQLRIHTETRQEKVYQLEVAKGGFKFNPVEPPVPPAKEGPVSARWGNDGGRVLADKSTLAGLAMTLGRMLRRTVIDSTGLTSFYSFDVRWDATEVAETPSPAPGFSAVGESLLISALQDKFGLRLSTTTAPVEYWVVDRVEQPTEN